MSEEVRSAMAELQSLLGEAERELEIAEQYVLQLNDRLNELADMNLIAPIMLLGDVIYHTDNSATWTNTSPSRVLQSSLGVGYGGAGVILWNAERYRQLRQEKVLGLENEGFNFTAFENCPQQVRHLLLPYLKPLVNRLCELVLN